MLHKRIDLGSQPFGLARAGEDIVKGRAVVVKVVDGELKAFYPTTDTEADDVKGFATFRIEEEGGADTDFDIIKEGTWVVIYTLVKDNMWATTEFTGTPNADDEYIVESGTGKLIPVGATGRTPQFIVYDVQEAGAGYTDSMIEVIVK